MEFEQKEHDKLIENVEKIFNYLIENVVPKICHKIKINFFYENGKIQLVIYPKSKEECFELINDDKTHYCFSKLRKCFYNGRGAYAYYYLAGMNFTPLMFDIESKDCIMYSLVENFEYIKEKCKEAFDKDEEMKQKILSFEIE